MAQIQKVSWWHEQIVDWMLSNPKGTLGQCAGFFAVTQPWLSTVINSDAFKDYMSRRRAEHQRLLSQNVVEKVEGLAHLSLEVLHDRIEAERHQISLGLVRETADMALKACGYRANSGPQVNVQIGLVDPTVLARAREKMRVINNEEESEQPTLPPAA